MRVIGIQAQKVNMKMIERHEKTTIPIGYKTKTIIIPTIKNRNT